MSSFHEFLRSQIQRGTLSTEDVLISFLPLLEQVIATHDKGDVAPLEGVEDLRMDDVAVGYAESDHSLPRQNLRAVRRLVERSQTAVEIVGESQVVFDVQSCVQDRINLQVATPGDLVTQPVFVVGYVCWEHLVDHHDPTTDVFSLGLILCSLACGLDLSDPGHHDRFVDNRTNLFRVNPLLHPVLARTIAVMTELDRHKRPQDLHALLATLDHYRDQEVDFETDLASTHDLQLQDRSGKRKLILSKLQERLFEINRRNRLLQFRSNLQTINLTQSSIPISFDVANIRDNQVVTWNGAFRDKVAGQNPVQLNSTLNFREAVYLPGALDRLRAEAKRDENEYGFAELKLIICFLRWADLKSNPVERYESPLLLVPVQMDVKKGIHDRYFLTSLDTVAEVNPVVRHLFKQLYNIDLPEQVGLADSGVEAFYEQLKTLIQSSDSSVELARIDRPRIRMIQERARRRLDQFQRRTRLSGRGIRQFMDLDYSYDSVSYHPLGTRLFDRFVRPTAIHLTEVVTGSASKRPGLIPDTVVHRDQLNSNEADVSAADANRGMNANCAVAEQQFYSLESEADENPFNWEFDLCSVTLANLKYRRMSLVRDYTRLVNDNTENAAFEATFSINPVDRTTEISDTEPVDELYHVVPCDPTQQDAIVRARSGRCYIIQGPPGTGKSQTITNLIADYIVRGKRVLFVCEKRAAIDVVYHRLKQEGLQELCCLIHDSQSDKKQFVMDLKQTYEAFLAEATSGRDHHRTVRDGIVQRRECSLMPLSIFNSVMMSVPVTSGVPVRKLLDRLIVLRNDIPELVPRDWERVCDFANWHAGAAGISAFQERLLQVQPDGVMANHPLCLLSDKVIDADLPVELVTECVEQCVGSDRGNTDVHDCDLEPVANGQLRNLIGVVESLVLPSEVMSSLKQLKAAVEYAVQSRFLADHDLFELIDPDSTLSARYREGMRQLEQADTAVARAQEATVYWREKLSSEDTRSALQLASQLDGNLTSVLKPSWWRLRRALNKSYDFSKHAVKPTWRHVLQQLDNEHEKLAAQYDAAQAMRNEFLIEWDLNGFHANLMQLRASRQQQPGPIRTLSAFLLSEKHGSRKARNLAELAEPLKRLSLSLDRFIDEYEHHSLTGLLNVVVQIQGAIDQLPGFLHCLGALKLLPERMRLSIRSLPLTLNQLEAASAEKTLQSIYRGNRLLSDYDQKLRAEKLFELAALTKQLRQANAACVREAVRQKFNDQVGLSERSATLLTPAEREFRKVYTRGRRELEREFGKSMRYRSIRELADGDSGVVIRDLKPVWLMSPLSVSDTLPLTAEHFDVVIFDEASQITLEEAIPSLFRAEQAIVVGDEMQLPPTSFFAARRDDDDELTFEEDGYVVQYDLNSNSFLNHSSRSLPSRMLGWHYRSRSESLISFSNHAFYGGRLLTVPEERLARNQLSEIVVANATDGKLFATEMLDRPVSFHFLQQGIYEKRRNRAEAEYVAELVRELLIRDEGHSIGVVAFSEAQQEEIERSIRRLAEDDAEFAELLEAEWDRELDGQFIGLLIKNLENIQGDERDIIILSVCYGPDSGGKVKMNFGPINMSGGEKRLNVAFSRAKKYMALVTSMRSSAITNDYNDGASCLKAYLRYAECSSVGHSEGVRSILRQLSGLDNADRALMARPELLADEICEAVQNLGFVVDRRIGQSQFYCDLAIYGQGDAEYRLGIMIDGELWYSQTDLLERELMKPQLLAAFGWQIMTVFALDWYHNRAAVIDSIGIALGRTSEIS